MPADVIKALVMAASINSTLYFQLDPKWNWVQWLFANKVRVAILSTVCGLLLTAITGNPLMSGMVEILGYPVMCLKVRQVKKANKKIVYSESYSELLEIMQSVKPSV